MPWGVAAAVGASVAGAATSSLLSPSGGGTSSSSGQPYYTPGGLGAADQAWQDLLTSQQGLYNAGNPYAGGYQGAANYAGNRFWDLGNQATNVAGIQYAQSDAARQAQQYLQGAGRDVFNLALDPQNALYNRTQQQLTDQVNAGQALRGLGTSAVGGSEYNQAMSNFNIDWQNQQLNRALQGAQGLSGLYGQAGNYAQASAQDLAQGLGAYNTGANAYLQAGQTPYGAANTIQNQQLAQAQGIQGQIIPYLNYGQGAVGNAYAAGSQNAGAAGALVNQGIQGLGSAAQNYFAGSGGGGGYGYSGPGSLFGGSTGASGYGASPVSGFNTGVQYGMGTNYGFG